MNLHDYKLILLNNLNPEDWTYISCAGSGSGPSYRNEFAVWTNGAGGFINLEVKSHYTLLSLKSDLSIQIAFGLDDNPDFKEVWANANPNPKASSCFVDFFYNNQLIYREVAVIVDGGRCYLPLPQLEYDSNYQITSIKVEREKYEIFSLLNGSARSLYDRYIQSSDFLLIDEPWMV